jgi:hypothetical protein
MIFHFLKISTITFLRKFIIDIKYFKYKIYGKKFIVYLNIEITLNKYPLYKYIFKIFILLRKFLNIKLPKFNL